MADTIITNTPESSDSSAAGWAVALLIALAVIVGGVVWYRYYRAPAPTSTTNNSINVSVPAATTPAPAAPAPTTGGTTH